MALVIGQLHPLTVRTGLCVHVVLVPLCVPFTNPLIEFYFSMIVLTIIGILWPLFIFWTTRLGLLYQSSSGSANAHLIGCFPLNIGLSMLPSDSFMSCIDSLLEYILQGTFWLCNWLPLRWLAPLINRLPPVCWSTFWKSSLKWNWASLMHCSVLMFYFRLPCFQVLNSALSLTYIFLYTIYK